MMFRSHFYRPVLTICLLAIILLLTPPASADDAVPSLSSLQQQIDDFANSPQYRFAHDSTARARAMLAAATMAEKRQDAAARDQAASQALEALSNAQRIAEDFKAKYATTLKLEQAAREASGNIPDSSLIAAQETLSDLIRAFEQGRLNDSAMLAEDANKQFLAVLHSKLPPLLEKTDAALLAASRKNAKRYAPVTYGYARKWLADALAYNDGLSDKWPEHPRLGLKLANRASALAEQIMQWRKKPDSYEELVLKARQNRLAAAQALGLNIDEADPSTDIDNARIIEAIRKEKQRIHKQQEAYQQQITALEAQYQLRLSEKTDSLRTELTQQQGEQMSAMKEAFRAKLERETFETRRQQKLGELFKKGEVEILANVDGSLLLRLTALQFASGVTGIDKKYYDLLSRVRNGLDLYPDRKVVIEGHTDNRGEPKINQRLSLRRAETVRDFLIAAGMDGSRLKALGYGEVRPIASNDYDRGRAMNRRIDIIIQPPAK